VANEWNIASKIHDWGMLVGTNVPNNCPQPVMEYIYYYYCCVVCQMQHSISFYDKTSTQGKFNKNV